MSVSVYLDYLFLLSDGTVEDDEMVSGDEHDEEVLHVDVELQIYNAIDSRFLLQLVRILPP